MQQPGSGWMECPSQSDQLVFCKFQEKNGAVQVVSSVAVDGAFSWKVHYCGQEVHRGIALLASMPSMTTSVSDLEQLVHAVDASVVCVGNSDGKYGSLVQSRRGRFKDHSGMHK